MFFRPSTLNGESDFVSKHPSLCYWLVDGEIDRLLRASGMSVDAMVRDDLDHDEVLGRWAVSRCGVACALSPYAAARTENIEASHNHPGTMKIRWASPVRGERLSQALFQK